MFNFLKGGSSDHEVYGDGSSDEAVERYNQKLAITGGAVENDEEGCAGSLPPLLNEDSKSDDQQEDDESTDALHNGEKSAEEDEEEEEGKEEVAVEDSTESDKTAVMPALSLSSLEDLDEPSTGIEKEADSNEDDSALPESLRRQRAQDAEKAASEKKKPVLERKIPSFSIPDFNAYGISDRKWTIACAVLAGISLISIGFAAVTYMGSRGAADAPQEDLVSCIAVSSTVSAGDVISEDDLVTIDVPAEFVPFDAALSSEEVAGRLAVTNLSAGLPISLSCVEGSIMPGDLTTAVRTGYVAQQFSLDSAAGLAPFLAPGDYVDIQYGYQVNGSVQLETMDNIRVLAVGEQLQGEQTDSYSSLTFELTPAQADTLAMATGMYVTAVPRSEWPADAVGAGADDAAADGFDTGETSDEEGSSSTDDTSSTGGASRSSAEEDMTDSGSSSSSSNSSSGDGTAADDSAVSA